VSPDNYCCEQMMRALSFDYPLEDSLFGMDMTLANRTEAGNVSKAGQMAVMICYCPWCGADVRKGRDA
jgi:hypothetical protein